MGCPLPIIDGDNLEHRAHHSTPKSVENDAVVGFTRTVANLREKGTAKGSVRGLGHVGESTPTAMSCGRRPRRGVCLEYEIVMPLKMLSKIVRAFAFGLGKRRGSEADDPMASAAKAEVTVRTWTCNGTPG